MTKAYIRKSLAQIGSGILLILSHAGLTATTDSALLHRDKFCIPLIYSDYKDRKCAADENMSVCNKSAPHLSP